MSNRIREIRDQALTQANQEQLPIDRALELFAELIVKDCIEVVRASHRYGNDIAKRVTRDVVKDIRHHFKVK